mmetsp:Transcript_29052/g.67684  ORF Transcript_29052/g.67684 Transcript_29052/m.67684 type:complete len:93 (+) Transcript_29052:256-534(+)
MEREERPFEETTQTRHGANMITQQRAPTKEKRSLVVIKSKIGAFLQNNRLFSNFFQSTSTFAISNHHEGYVLDLCAARCGVLAQAGRWRRPR